jgi:hypothetical protein
MKLMTKGVVVGIILLFIGATIVPTVHFTAVTASSSVLQRHESTPQELLFQLIIDITNNNDIRTLYANAQTTTGVVPHIFRLSAVPLPALTMKELRTEFRLGLLLFKFFGKTQITTMARQYALHHQQLQTQITAAMKKDEKITSELSQLQSLDCHCSTSTEATSWGFPVLCIILVSLYFISLTLLYDFGVGGLLFLTSFILANIFNCMPEP